MQLSSLKFIKSKTRAAILALFFSHPENEYYLRQIENLTGYSVGNIRREITRLELDGLFSCRNIGKIKLYKLNKAYSLYNEIKSIIRKTIGIEGGLKEILKNLKDVDFAFIYGSLAKGQEKISSDIDIIVIGGVKPKEIKSLLFEYQSKIDREINSIVYTKREFLSKLKDKNHFVASIVKAKKIFVKGDKNDFRRFIQIRQTPETQN